MNKYLLSLFLFGFFLTEQIYSQGEGGGGESSGESSGEDSSDGESSGEDSSSEGGSGGSGSGSGGGNAPDPNYVVDRYTFAANDTYAPNPYPLDMCVQISIWDNDPDGKYATFECTNTGGKVTKTFYTDSNCSTPTGTTKEYNSGVNDTDGDIRTFYCDGDDYSFTLAVDCASSTVSGDTITVVPYVCYFDGDSSKTISNAWVCDEDDNEDYFAYFATYRGVDDCDEDEATTFSTKNITEDCTSGDDSSPFTSNVAGDNYAVKIQSSASAWNCPSAQSGNTGDDDDDDDDSMASLVSLNNGLFMILASSIYALMQ